MKPIGRKVYYAHGDKVIAVEVFSKTPEKFRDCYDIDVTDNKLQVMEMCDILGDRREIYQGESLFSLEGKRIYNFADILEYSPRTFVSHKDINEAKTRLEWDLCTDVLSASETGLSESSLGYIGTDNLFGFIEVPSVDDPGNKIVSNQLSCIAFRNNTNHYYVPVKIFQDNGIVFDNEIPGEEDLPWIVFYMGCDDSSYGKRFQTEEHAIEFAQTGFLAGYEKLCWMN